METKKNFLLPLVSLIFIFGFFGVVSAEITAVDIIDPITGDYLSGVKTIEWSLTGFDEPGDRYNVDYSPDSGSTWISINDNPLAPGSTSLSWDTDSFNGDFQIRVQHFNSGFQNENVVTGLTLDNLDPTIQTDTLIDPDGGEIMAGGNTFPITWTSGDITDTNLGSNPITLEYSTDDSIWNSIATGEANDGIFTWPVASIDSPTVKVRITATDLAGNSVSDKSDAVFEIDSTDPSIDTYTIDKTTISPNGDGIDDSASIDLRFTEEVSVDFDVLDSSGTKVKDVYSDSAVTDPTLKVWDGKANSNVVVPDGLYTLRISLVDSAGNTIEDTSKTITVDTSIIHVGGGSSFTKIQDAIDAANPGDTIQVAADTYDEDVLIDKSLTLKSVDGKASTIINGQSSGQEGAVTISASNVVVGGTDQGFTINSDGNSGRAVYLRGNLLGLTLQDNRLVSSNNRPALEAMGGQTDHTIIDNTFEGVANQLVYINGQASVGVPSTNVDFIGNTFDGTATGPALGQEATDSEISDNTFTTTTGYTRLELWGGSNSVTGNTFEGALLGSQLVDNTKSLNMEDVLANNIFDRAVVIDRTGASLLHIIWSNIQNAVDNAQSDDTIQVAGGTYNEDLTIDESLTLNGAQAGVDARGRSASESEIVGVVVVTFDATNVIFDGFKFTSPTRAFNPRGFNLHIESESSTIRNNIFVAEENAGHTYSGYLDLEDITDTLIEKNEFSGDLDPIQEPNVIRLGISGAGTVTVSNNEMHDVGGGGGIGIMSTNAGAIINIENNEIDNTGDGIWVWSPSTTQFDTLTIDSNNIHNSGKKGVKLVGTFGEGDVVEIHNNKIHDNAEEGVFNGGEGLTVNAKNNWWGHITGPSEVGPGDGDAVSTNVNFDPWWITETGGNDVTPPESEITLSGIIYKDIGTFDLPYTASDDKGLKRIRLHENGGVNSVLDDTLDTYPTSHSGTFERTVGEDGTYEYYTIAVDIRDTDFGGAENAPGTPDVTIIVDTIDPIIDSISAPTVTSDTTVTVTGTFIELNIATIIVNGVLAIKSGNTYSADVTLTEGLNTITVVATDLAGNTGKDTTSVTLDTTDPLITDVTDVIGRVVSESSEISATVTDINEVASVTLHFVVDGVPDSVPMNGGGPVYTATIPASTENGIVTYHVKATDSVENSETSDEFTILVNDLIWDLNSQWNLVSVPKTLVEKNKITLLPSNTVHEYDAKAGTFVTNPSTINPGVGYWVDDGGNAEVGLDYAEDCTGPECFPSETIILEQGWNLIGHMCINEQDIEEAFPSSVYDNLFVLRFNEAAGPKGSFEIYATQDPESAQFEQMVPGEGYWVFVPEGDLAYTNTC